MQANDRTQSDGTAPRCRPTIDFGSTRCARNGRICSGLSGTLCPALRMARASDGRLPPCRRDSGCLHRIFGLVATRDAGVDPRTSLFAIARNCWRRHCRARASRKEQIADWDEVAEEIAGTLDAGRDERFEQAVDRHQPDCPTSSASCLHYEPGTNSISHRLESLKAPRPTWLAGAIFVAKAAADQAAELGES